MCKKIKQTKAYQKMAAMTATYAPRVKSTVSRYKKPIAYTAAGLVALWAVTTLLTPCGGGKIGVLDIGRLRLEANPYHTVTVEQQKYEELWKMKFMAEKEILDGEDKKLAEAMKKKTMKPKQLSQEIESLQKKALALQKKYQAEAAKIVAASQSVLKQLDELTLELAAEVAKEEGYEIIFPDRVVYASARADVTDKVIKALNKKSVQIKYPDPQTLTPAPVN